MLITLIRKIAFCYFLLCVNIITYNFFLCQIVNGSKET